MHAAFQWSPFPRNSSNAICPAERRCSRCRRPIGPAAMAGISSSLQRAEMPWTGSRAREVKTIDEKVDALQEGIDVGWPKVLMSSPGLMSRAISAMPGPLGGRGSTK